MNERAHALEKLLAMEQASADRVDATMVDWLAKMRELARSNVAMQMQLWETLNFARQTGQDLGEHEQRIERLLELARDGR